MKKKIATYVLLFLMTVFLQVLVGEYVFIWSVTPNLLMIMVTVLTMIAPQNALYGIYAVFAGFLQDALYYKQLGFHMMFYVCIVSVIAWLRIKIMKNNLLFCVLFVFVSTFLYEMIVYLFFGFMRMGVSIQSFLVTVFLPMIVVNVLCTPLLYGMMNLLFGHLAKREADV